MITYKQDKKAIRFKRKKSHERQFGVVRYASVELDRDLSVTTLSTDAKRVRRLAKKTRERARGKRISVVAPGVDVSAYSVGVTFRFPPTNPCFFPHFPPFYPRLILLLGQVVADDGRIYACRVVARVYTPPLPSLSSSLSLSLSLCLI